MVSLQIFLHLETLNEQWKKMKTVSHVFYDSAEVYIKAIKNLCCSNKANFT